MTILSTSQREFIAADTHIHPLIIQRCVDAFDLLLRGDREGYITHMETAIALLGYEGPVPERDRPTAVDVMKTILIRAYADQRLCSFKTAHHRLTRMLEE